MPLEPLDPSQFSLAPEQRTADKFANLDRRVGMAERGTLRAGVSQRAGGALIDVGQTLSSGALTALSWTGTIEKGGVITVSGTRLTLLVDGTWSVSANVEFASNATGFRRMEVARNGAARRLIQACVPAASGSTTALSGSQLIHCAAGDYLEMYCQQNSGGNLDVLPFTGTTIGPNDPFQLSVVRLGS